MSVFSGYFLLNILQEWEKCVICMHDVQQEPHQNQEVPGCKPHNNERMSTTPARRSENVNEKNSEYVKNVVTGNVRRSAI